MVRLRQAREMLGPLGATLFVAGLLLAVIAAGVGGIPVAEATAGDYKLVETLFQVASVLMVFGLACALVDIVITYFEQRKK